MDYKYSAALKGKVYQSLAESYEYTLRNDGKFAGVGVEVSTSNSTTTTILTGYYVERTAGQMCLTTKGYWILPNEWQETGKRGSVKEYSDADANKLLKEIIRNNKIILQNNLICARFSKYLTQSEKRNVAILQQNLEQRNSELKNSNLVTDVSVAEPKGVANYATALESLMSDYSAGKLGIAVSTITTIVVAALAIAGIGTIVYLNYIQVYNDSALDVKYSDELLAKLKNKLTEEEYQQLEKETQGMITKAYFKGTGSGVTGLVKWALIAVGGYVAYTTVKKFLNKKSE